MSVEYRYDIFDPPTGKSRIICVDDKMTLNELSSLLQAAFERPILGFTDENKFIYPLSVLISKTKDHNLSNLGRLVTVGGFNDSGNEKGNNLVRQNAVADLMNPSGGMDADNNGDDGDDDTTEGIDYEDIDDYIATANTFEINNYNQRPLTLEESIEEMNLLVGFGSVDVRTVLELLPTNKKSRSDNDGTYDWIQSLPLSLSREDFVELVTVLASLVRDGSSDSPDEELINLLFDVLLNPSDMPSEKDGRTRSVDDEIDVTTLASGLTLLCSGDESANLAVVFSLYCKRDNLLIGNDRNVVPDVSVYLHLSACFRLVYQLCSSLGKSADLSPEDLAHKYSLGQFSDMRDREYDNGFLSFREFDQCCKHGFRQGLFALHDRMNAIRGPSEYGVNYVNDATKEEIEQVKRLPAYDQTNEDGEHPPSYEDSHHHESSLPPYEHTFAHRTVLPVPPEAVSSNALPPSPPQAPFLGASDLEGGPQMHIHDHSLYRSYLQSDQVPPLGGEQVFEVPPKAPHADDTDHDRHFPHGELGRHYFHHREVSSDDSDGAEDHHFPRATHGKDYHFIDEGKARSFHSSSINGFDGFMAPGDNTASGNVATEDSNTLEDSLVAASLVEYDGGPIDVLKAQQLLGFKGYQPDVILSSLLYAATDDGDVPLSSYHRLFDQLMRKRYSHLSVLQRSVADYIVSQIFDTFDSSGKGFIKMEELGWSLLIFCDGAPNLKAKAATALMNSHVDTDLQGGLKAGDMIYCLNSVLKTVCALNKDFVAPMQPEQIAEELTICAFQHAGVNYLNDDSIDVEDAAQYWQEVNAGSAPTSVPSMISVADFEHWFGVVISQFEFEGALSLPSDVSLASTTSRSVASSSSAESMSIPRLDSEPDINSYGGLHSDASELRSSLDTAASEESGALGGWKRNLMVDTMDSEDSSGGEEDGEYDESVQTSEDESALAAVYPEEKFLNFSDYPEFAGMDDSVTSGSRADAEASVSNSDVPSQSQSDYEEVTTQSSGYESESTTDERGSSTVTIEMRSASSLLGLNGFPADDLMEVLGEASKNNLLQKDRWLMALSYMVQLAGGKSTQLDMARALGERLFSIFQDADTEGGVSYPEFAAGLSVLCSGCSLQDKIMVAFTLVDSDSDGLIDIQELRTLILAVLRVVYVSSQIGRAKVDSTGASLESMASVIVKEAYTMFDLHPSEQINTELMYEMCSDYVLLATGARPEA